MTQGVCFQEVATKEKKRSANGCVLVWLVSFRRKLVCRVGRSRRSARGRGFPCYLRPASRSTRPCALDQEPSHEGDSERDFTYSSTGFLGTVELGESRLDHHQVRGESFCTPDGRPWPTNRLYRLTSVVLGRRRSGFTVRGLGNNNTRVQLELISKQEWRNFEVATWEYVFLSTPAQ